MHILIFFLLSLFFSLSFSASTSVSTSQALQNALNTVNPGDTITLTPNTIFTCINGNEFLLSRSGTAQSRITISGAASSIVQCTDITKGYVFHIDGASYITLSSITIRTAQKGLVNDRGSNNIFDGIRVNNIGQEAVHIRDGSNNNIIQNSVVSDTGLVDPGTGEGIYIGSDKGKWTTFDPACDNNKILNNFVGPNIGAECIDIKEGSTGTLIQGNTFNATGIKGNNSADSWVDVKGNNCLIISNTGYQGTAVSPQFVDGFQTHNQIDDWGLGNVFDGNTGYFTSGFSGYLIKITYQSGANPNVVYTNNVKTGGAGSVSNIAVTTKPSSTTATTVSTTTTTAKSATSATSASATTSATSASATTSASTTSPPTPAPTPKPTPKPTPQPTPKPTPKPTTSTTGSASCGAANILYSQEVTSTFVSGGVTFYQYTLTISSTCSTKDLVALNSTVTNWNVKKYWGGVVNGNLVTFPAYLNVAPGDPFTAFGYQTSNTSPAIFATQSFRFQ